MPPLPRPLIQAWIESRVYSNTLPLPGPDIGDGAPEDHCSDAPDANWDEAKPILESLGMSTAARPGREELEKAMLELSKVGRFDDGFKLCKLMCPPDTGAKWANLSQMQRMIIIKVLPSHLCAPSSAPCLVSAPPPPYSHGGAVSVEWCTIGHQPHCPCPPSFPSGRKLFIPVMHGVFFISPKVFSRKTFLMPCCMHTDDRLKSRYAVGSRCFSTVRFPHTSLHHPSFPLLCEVMCL